MNQPNPTIIRSIFSDLPMFLSKNSFTGDFNVKKDLSSIREAVKNIVLTNLGERAFDFNFGGNIYGLLFELIQDKYRLSGIRIDLANMINRYDTRVDVKNINFSYNDPKVINITIEYSIVSLNTTDKLVIKLERSR